MAAIWGPRRALIVARSTSQGQKPSAIRVDGEYFKGPILVGNEGDLVSPGGPCRGGIVVPFESKPPDVGPFRIHDIDLGSPSLVAHEGDLAAIRRP